MRANRLDLGREIARFAPAIRHLAEIVAELLPRTSGRCSTGAAVAICRRRGAATPGPRAPPAVIFLTTALEVGDLAERTAQPIDRAARIFYGVGARFALDEMRAAARRLPAETAWQKAAAESLIDEFYGLQAELAAGVLENAVELSADGAADPLAAWIDTRADRLAAADAIAGELRNASAPDLAMLVVARQQLRQALG